MACCGRNKSVSKPKVNGVSTIINYYVMPPADSSAAEKGYGQDIGAAQAYAQSNPGWWLQARHEPV